MIGKMRVRSVVLALDLTRDGKQPSKRGAERVGIITVASASISPRSSMASSVVSGRMNSTRRPSGGLMVRTGRPITQFTSSGRTP